MLESKEILPKGSELKNDERDGIWPRPDGLCAVGTDRFDVTPLLAGIESDVHTESMEESEAVVSKGMGSRRRLPLARRGTVPDFARDAARELDDGGGKKESWETGMRRIVSGASALLTAAWPWLLAYVSSSGGRPEVSSSCDKTSSFALCDLSNGIYNTLRRWIGSDGHSWFAFRRSARVIPYLRATPASESLGEIYNTTRYCLDMYNGPSA